jgi:putative MATE family efflux protein
MSRVEVSQVAASAKFVSGSTMRHVLVMSATGSIGLLALFVVDVLNLYYISRLGQQELAAAVGYAGTILFFFISIGIGLSIAATALTSRALGAGNRQCANELAGASLLVMAVSMAVLALLLAPFLAPVLHALGARGVTADYARRFMLIVLPSVPLLGLGMAFGSLLRAVGDAKSAMYVTLSAGIATAILDPLFIFGFGWGLDGAAYANVLARLSMVVGGAVCLRRHRLYAWPHWPVLQRESRAFWAIGIPAILTQVATPVGNTVVTAAIAPYGDDAVAGWAVIVRLIPMAFCGLFALSGAVGPIIGQNLGARRFDRLRGVMRDSLSVTLVYVALVWLILALGSSMIADGFGARGLGRELIIFFCYAVSASFLFNGCLFVANAAFNNLGFAFYSTMLNWGRSTLGVIPFVWFGGQWYGAIGVLAGYGLGVVIFGVLGVVLCFRVLRRIEQNA